MKTNQEHKDPNSELLSITSNSIRSLKSKRKNKKGIKTILAQENTTCKPTFIRKYFLKFIERNSKVSIQLRVLTSTP